MHTFPLRACVDVFFKAKNFAPKFVHGVPDFLVLRFVLRNFLSCKLFFLFLMGQDAVTESFFLGA